MSSPYKQVKSRSRLSEVEAGGTGGTYRRQIANTGAPDHEKDLPCIELQMAVLKQAFDDLIKIRYGKLLSGYSGDQKRLLKSEAHRNEARELRAWFLSTRSDDLFSFERVCIVLNLNAEYVRRVLKKHQLLPSIRLV